MFCSIIIIIINVTLLHSNVQFISLPSRVLGNPIRRVSWWEAAAGSHSLYSFFVAPVDLTQPANVRGRPIYQFAECIFWKEAFPSKLRTAVFLRRVWWPFGFISADGPWHETFFGSFFGRRDYVWPAALWTFCGPNGKHKCLLRASQKRVIKFELLKRCCKWA